MSETWKSVVGFEGYYEVSDLGRVRSLNRVDFAGRRIKGKILKLIRFNTYGHYAAHLCVKNHRSKRSCHSLVLEAFVGPRPLGTESCHNDGDPANNRLDNLRWDSHRNNVADSYSHGTARQFSVVRSDGAIFQSIRQAARESDADSSHIVKVCKGKAQLHKGYGWRYV